MQIDILVAPSFDSTEGAERAISTKEIEKAIKRMNKRQRFFRFRFYTAPWAEGNVNGKSVIDYNAVYQEKEKNLGNSPTIIITKRPLKDGWLAIYYPGFYILSLGDWEVRYQAPPVSVLLTYYVAGICCSFACNIPEAGHEEMYHDGPPIGCISDVAPEGNS